MNEVNDRSLEIVRQPARIEPAHAQRRREPGEPAPEVPPDRPPETPPAAPPEAPPVSPRPDRPDELPPHAPPEAPGDPRET